MRNSEPESGLNFNLIMPTALLVVLLVVPFSINSLMHFVSAKKHLNSVTMRIPIDSAAITIPSQAKQYESFEVALNLETKQLSNFLNEIVSNASAGTAIQGIVGVVSPNMKAEIVGADFKIEPQGPQESSSTYNGVTHWKWRVTAESSGAHGLKFQLHLLTRHNAQQNTKVIDLAEANLSVQSNLSEWFSRHWLWIALLVLLVPIAILGLKRRYARHSG